MPYLRHKLPQASEEIRDPHNMVIEVWAESGVFAMLALLAALGIGLREILGPARGTVEVESGLAKSPIAGKPAGPRAGCVAISPGSAG